MLLKPKPGRPWLDPTVFRSIFLHFWVAADARIQEYIETFGSGTTTPNCCLVTVRRPPAELSPASGRPRKLLSLDPPVRFPPLLRHVVAPVPSFPTSPAGASSSSTASHSGHVTVGGGRRPACFSGTTVTASAWVAIRTARGETYIFVIVASWAIPRPRRLLPA
jgi:hypothetical protein